jgi:hypothetical protein
MMLSVLAAGSVLAAPLALAQTPWQASHPNRAQVLERADHLDRRIDHALLVGAIVPRRAQALHRQVAQVRWQQQVVAQRHGGGLPRAQWLALNRREDAIRREIGQ